MFAQLPEFALALALPFMDPSASMCRDGASVPTMWPQQAVASPFAAQVVPTKAFKKAKIKAPKKSKVKARKASQVLAQVQNFYAQAQDLQARFSQTYYKASLSVLARSSGWLRVKRPHLMQWDYDGKGQDIFANGKEVWFVDHETRQVISSKVSAKDNVNVGLKFLFGNKTLLRDYLVRFAKGNKLKRYGDAEHWVLQLKPRKKSQHFKGLVLSVDKSSGRVDRFVVYAHDNSSNYFELEQFQSNVGLADSVFRKEIPKGYVQTRE